MCVSIIYSIIGSCKHDFFGEGASTRRTVVSRVIINRYQVFFVLINHESFDIESYLFFSILWAIVRLSSKTTFSCSTTVFGRATTLRNRYENVIYRQVIKVVLRSSGTYPHPVSLVQLDTVEYHSLSPDIVVSPFRGRQSSLQHV